MHTFTGSLLLISKFVNKLGIIEIIFLIKAMQDFLRNLATDLQSRIFYITKKLTY